MSYFLEDAPQQPMAPRGPDQLLSTWMQGVGASFYQMLRDTNANGQRQREVGAEAADTVSNVYDRLGEASILKSLKEKGLVPQEMTALPQDAIRYNRDATEAVLQMGRDASATNPDAWKGVDLSPEGIQQRVTERRVAEDSDEQQILDMLPNGRGSAEFIGGAVGMIADIRQLPLLLLGGAEGSLLKIMAREAFLNTASEAITLPSQFETAKELSKPDPNIAATLGQAAVGGAVLGGAFHGIGRALEYYKGRAATPRVGPFDEAHSDIIVSSAENALTKGENPIVAADNAMRALPPEALTDAVAYRNINDVLDEFGPQRDPRIPENRLAFRVPQSATAITQEVPQVKAPAADFQTAVQNATHYQNARSLDPEAFDAVLDSQKKIATYRKWLAELADAQSKEVADILSALDAREKDLVDRINTMKTGGRRSIREEIAKIKQARQEAMSLSDRVETSDMAKVRRALMDEDARMRDFGPRVAKAMAEAKTSFEPWVPPQNSVTPDIQWAVPVRGAEIKSAKGEAPMPAVSTPEPVAGIREMFSDPASPEARSMQEIMTADLRDEIAKGDDFTVDMGDGKGERSASSVLDELDRNDAAAARIDLCGRGTT